MAQLEKEISTRLQGNAIMSDRLRGQIPGLLMIRGGRVVIDPVKQGEADKIEAQEDLLRAANARMKAAVERIKEITQHDLDKPYTLASLLSIVKSYETEKTSLEQDLIRIGRQLVSKEAMGFTPGFNTIDKRGVFHAAPDPVGELKKQKETAEKRIKELQKSIEKVSKVILKVQPILEEALKI